MNTASKSLFLMRYGIVGVIGGTIQTLILYFWVGILRLEAFYLLGATVGFCISLIVTFSLQKYWTFRDNVRAELRRQFIIYTSIALLSLGLNILFLHMSKLLLEHFGFDFFNRWYLFAQIAIIVLLATVSFIANYFITFRENRSVVIDS